ncbi:MAG: hypothetical protein ABFD64_10235 [Armatimonadota bacterium]
MHSDSPIMPAVLILLALFIGGFLMFQSPILFSYILIGFLILAGAAAVGIVVYAIIWFIRNRLSHVERVNAKVILRRKKDWDVSLIGNTPEMAAARLGMMGRDPQTAAKAYSKLVTQDDVPELELAAGSNYLVTFGFNDRECEFAVSEADYIKCDEGTEGLLVFRGEEFKYFIPNVR